MPTVNLADLYPFIKDLMWPLVTGVVLGLLGWKLGEKAIDDRTKSEAIRELMFFRGDPSTPDFKRSLNKVSITFHKDTETRKEIRELYEIMNNPSPNPQLISRKTVGLIYDLCQKNGFNNITEYDIDQAFPESAKQIPELQSTLTKSGDLINQETGALLVMKPRKNNKPQKALTKTYNK